ncbi:MAG: carbohydrate kinase [Lachnospiraceae bacterium]|jgi:fructokinase|nr:carbohydrate kinase [Lachnospiraceae bacterium]
MRKTIDAVALGELLIDFPVYGKSEQGNLLMEACPGGAVCNAMAILAKLGRKTAFIGKVGDDGFGHLLEKTLSDCGIDNSALKKDPHVHTTLAIVQTLAGGDRDFSFYRKPGADIMLTEDEVDYELIKQSKIFYFGTLSMTDLPVRNALFKAIEVAKEAGCMLCFDPNLREPLWDNLEDAKKYMRYGFEQCDVLKISDNEVEFVTGKDIDTGIIEIIETYEIPLTLLTLGKAGSRAYYRGIKAEQCGFSVQTVDTTGAGDTFFGAAIDRLIEKGFFPYRTKNLTASDNAYGYDMEKEIEKEIDEESLKEILRFANAAAALITTRKGALRSMPDLQEIYRCF